MAVKKKKEWGKTFTWDVLEEDRIKWIGRATFPRLPRLKAVESQTGNQVMKVMEVRHKLYLGQHVFHLNHLNEAVHVQYDGVPIFLIPKYKKFYWLA